MSKKHKHDLTPYEQHMENIDRIIAELDDVLNDKEKEHPHED